MDWYLNRALTTFRNEVNAAYPERDKASDGTVGNEEHQETTSDHNPDSDGSVDAWDMDVDLRVPNTAAELERLKKVFQAHPAARYWIHNRQIAHRSNGWKREYYSGKNPHDHHIHWNSEPAHEDSTRPWGVEVDMPLTDTDAKKVAAAVAAWDYKNGDGVEMAYQVALRAADNAVAGKTAATKAAADTTVLKTEVAGLKSEVAGLTAAVLAIRPVEPTVISDEQLERVLRKVIGSVDSAA